MSLGHQSRRGFSLSLLAAPLLATSGHAWAASSKRVSIRDAGAISDGKTVNTRMIQATIDKLAAQGGGTVVVPEGVFISGALFLKPRVNLHLDRGGVIRASQNVAVDFPAQRTRIEGHFEPAFTPALINAKGCNGLQITGEGTLDGAGEPVWELFYKMRREYTGAGGFPNIGLPRARLALLEESKGVLVEGVTFQNSQFWNLHLYKCQDVTVRNAHFEIPDGKEAPSSDGIDIDSCQKVVVDGCTFNVTDDAIACKGSKGPFAAQDKDSPPVQNIRVRNCYFKRAHQALSCGSEATLVRDVVMENCKLELVNNMAMLKLRPDTPQHYEDVHFRNITLDNDRGTIITAQPWLQYRDLKGQPPPSSIVRNISLEGIKGRFGSFGVIRPNPGQTTISDILLKDFDVQLTRETLMTAEVRNLRFENVRVNGKPVTGSAPFVATPRPPA